MDKKELDDSYEKLEDGRYFIPVAVPYGVIKFAEEYMEEHNIAYKDHPESINMVLSAWLGIVSFMFADERMEHTINSFILMNGISKGHYSTIEGITPREFLKLYRMSDDFKDLHTCDKCKSDRINKLFDSAVKENKPDSDGGQHGEIQP